MSVKETVHWATEPCHESQSYSIVTCSFQWSTWLTRYLRDSPVCVPPSYLTHLQHPLWGFRLSHGPSDRFVKGGLLGFMPLSNARPNLYEIETRSRNEIPSFLLIFQSQRGLSIGKVPQIAFHNSARLYGDQTNPIMRTTVWIPVYNFKFWKDPDLIFGVESWNIC